VSDDNMMNSPEPVTSDATPAEPAFVSAPARKGFEFTMSNALMIAAAAIILVAIIGVVAWVILGAGAFSPTTEVPGGPVAGAPVVPGPSIESSTTTGSLAPVASVDNRDVFTPRNPFEPLDAPKVETETADATSTANTNTLVLVDIVMVDGEREAVVKLGGVEYTVGEDEVIGNSDYKVLEVNSNSIVVLFGDDRFTLSVGTGTSK